MRQSFIASISEKVPGTWERCKELQSWGLATDRPVLGRAAIGDRLLVYIGGAGVVAECKITRLRFTELDPDRQGSVDGRRYPFRIGFEVTQEFTPRPLKFPQNMPNPDTGLVQGLRRSNSPDRWVNAANVFIEMGNNGEIETCLMAFKPFWNETKAGGVRPDGWVPPKNILTQLMGIARV